MAGMLRAFHALFSTLTLPAFAGSFPVIATGDLLKLRWNAVADCGVATSAQPNTFTYTAAGTQCVGKAKYTCIGNILSVYTDCSASAGQCAGTDPCTGTNATATATDPFCVADGAGSYKFSCNHTAFTDFTANQLVTKTFQANNTCPQSNLVLATAATQFCSPLDNKTVTGCHGDVITTYLCSLGCNVPINASHCKPAYATSTVPLPVQGACGAVGGGIYTSFKCGFDTVRAMNTSLSVRTPLLSSFRILLTRYRLR